MTTTLARRSRGGRRGFTLPELMVSLAAGLIVTIAVVGLAKTATTTFHEQVRSSASEMSLRLASQRLSADLERVSYMSTGNIRWDPQIVRLDSAPLPATGSRYLSLNDLQGIRIYLAGSAENPAIQRESDNGLAPEMIDLTGNFTSNDEYIISQISAPPNPLLGGACPTQTVTLNPKDAATLKILVKTLPDGSTPPRSQVEAQKVLRSIFMPGGGSFAARVLDPNSGSTHYVIVADAVVSAGPPPLGLVATIKFADPTGGGCPVLWGGQGKGGTSGFGENLQIAPIQTVRWRIARIANADLDPTEDAAEKLDLTRQFIDVTNTPIGAPEIIAEYAVDLKVAFTVDKTIYPSPPNAFAMDSFDFEDTASNLLWANKVTAGPPRPPASGEGPHRIRSVRFRLSERAARDDRTQDFAPIAPGYLYRYCLTGPPATCNRFARVRTLVSEVALQNQARMNY